MRTSTRLPTRRRHSGVDPGPGGGRGRGSRVRRRLDGRADPASADAAAAGAAGIDDGSRFYVPQLQHYQDAAASGRRS